MTKIEKKKKNKRKNEFWERAIVKMYGVIYIKHCAKCLTSFISFNLLKTLSNK